MNEYTSVRGILSEMYHLSNLAKSSAYRFNRSGIVDINKLSCTKTGVYQSADYFTYFENTAVRLLNFSTITLRHLSRERVTRSLAELEDAYFACPLRTNLSNTRFVFSSI